jgi:multicomponent Na+:H+ antiporter subunit E
VLLGLAIGLVMAPLGEVAGPWALLRPRRAAAVLRLAGYALVSIIGANLRLARRIWSPSRPLRSGMVIVSTCARTDGELAATGLISSLIVDNQIVDLDRSEHVLQYHAVAVPTGPDARAAINLPIERRVGRIRQPGARARGD